MHGTRGSVVKQAIDPQDDQLLAGVLPDDDGWGVDDDPPLVLDDSGAEAVGSRRCEAASITMTRN